MRCLYRRLTAAKLYGSALPSSEQPQCCAVPSSLRCCCPTEEVERPVHSDTPSTSPHAAGNVWPNLEFVSSNFQFFGSLKKNYEAEQLPALE